MNLINLISADCKNCYKCLRYCSVKSIKFKNDIAQIIHDDCIACGQCLIVCPQEARYIKSDVMEVKKTIKSDIKVVASIAPSFAGNFLKKDWGRMVTALKKLGFDHVEETATGAAITTRVYEEHFKNNIGKYAITSACPSVNYLIEKHYPELVKYILPYDSPMTVHGKLIKNKYGEDTYVVFIGPCVAKKLEAEIVEGKRSVDAVITFNELENWFKKEKIDMEELEAQKFDTLTAKDSKSYPLTGSIVENLKLENSVIEYEKINVDGVDNCMSLFKDLEADKLGYTIVEANACLGGCIGGPMATKEEDGFFAKVSNVRKYIKTMDIFNEDTTDETENIDINKYTTKFSCKKSNNREIPDYEIVKILRGFGKYKKTDELDCGACGYYTCRDKAKAIYEGKSEASMCVPYMREKAESKSDIIFENTPNALFILDKNMFIKEMNPVAKQTFKIGFEDVGKSVLLYLTDENIAQAMVEKKSIIGNKVFYKENDLIMLQSIIYIPKEEMYIVILSDVSQTEKRKIEILEFKNQTMDAAQAVIVKQMRVAQEIASLLGETTAETKTTLTKLKSIVNQEAGDK